MDFLYSVITRPIANEPEQKAGYAVQPTYKDGKAKAVGEEEQQKNQKQAFQQNDEAEDNASETDLKSASAPKGKGIYRDEDGRRHLDIYV